ncbi:50S ribosomal protein L14 [Patescibacteria group bacterium]|nr:50S ribosomal protein L14 [Patescibacteria group bacterium]
MIQNKSKIKVADNTGAKIIECIRVLGGGRPNYAQVGDIFTASVKEVNPGGIVKKKEIVQAVLVRQKKNLQRPSGVIVSFDENAAVIIEGENPRGSRIFGPVARELKDKGFNKIVSLASEVL